jgi:hypothetical protein
MPLLPYPLCKFLSMVLCCHLFLQRRLSRLIKVARHVGIMNPTSNFPFLVRVDPTAADIAAEAEADASWGNFKDDELDDGLATSTSGSGDSASKGASQKLASSIKKNKK